MLMDWSEITPTFFVDPIGVIEDAPISNAGIFRDLTLCGDAKYIIFVLLSFSFRRFWVIHSPISAIQYSKLFREEEKLNSLSGSSDIYSCVSSAYKWYLTAYRCAMIPGGRVYIVKNRGPRTEPCGMSDNKTECQIKYHEQTLSGALLQIGSKPFKYFTWQTKPVFNLEKITLWSTVSNASDRSRRTSITGLPWSIDIIT